MSVRIHERSIACADQGLIFHSVDLTVFDASQHKPANGKAVWLVMQDEDGELCWEHGEHQDGTGLGDEGWYFIGMNRPIPDVDYKVLMWCDEPQLPDLKALQWGAHGPA